MLRVARKRRDRQPVDVKFRKTSTTIALGDETRPLLSCEAAPPPFSGGIGRAPNELIWQDAT